MQTIREHHPLKSMKERSHGPDQDWRTEGAAFGQWYSRHVAKGDSVHRGLLPRTRVRSRISVGTTAWWAMASAASVACNCSCGVEGLEP